MLMTSNDTWPIIFHIIVAHWSQSNMTNTNIIFIPVFVLCVMQVNHSCAVVYTFTKWPFSPCHGKMLLIVEPVQFLGIIHFMFNFKGGMQCKQNIKGIYEIFISLKVESY